MGFSNLILFRYLLNNASVLKIANFPNTALVFISSLKDYAVIFITYFTTSLFWSLR